MTEPSPANPPPEPVGPLTPATPADTPALADGSPLVPTWVRVLVILTVLPLWAAGVIYSMVVLDKLPDAVWMGIPSAIIVAAAPAWRWPGRGRQTESGGGGQ